MKKITGATAILNMDFDLMKQAGISSLRFGLGFPFEEDGKTPSHRFLACQQEALRLHDAGFDLMGGTFGPGSYRYDDTAGATVWVPSVPAWAGGYGDDSFYEFAESAGAYLAQSCKELCTYWQVANEPDIDIFHGDMSREQNVRFLKAVARGLKRGNPAAKPGINLGFMNAYAEWLLGELYRCEDSPFDYIGIDGYMGSWQEGGPEDWKWYIEKAHALTGKPVIINEWGYSTLQRGPNPDPEGLRTYNQDVCRDKSWVFQWKGDHTPDTQAEYIRQCMKIFAESPHVIGEFFFRWCDTETCWQCGDPLCPSECAWGIVDTAGKPKPGYWALKEAYEAYFMEPSVETGFAES